MNMIGSVRAGNMSNNNVEGWPGYRISEVADKAKLSLPEMPNVVLIEAGSRSSLSTESTESRSSRLMGVANDMIQDYMASTAPLRMGNLVDSILEVVPGTMVIVATLIPNAKPSTEARILTFNENLQVVVSNRTREGKKVSLVDMHSDWFSTADLEDGTHPTELGYLKMAKVFYTGIVAAAVAGNISTPQAVKGIDDYNAGNDSSIAGTAMDVVCQTVKGETMGLAQKQQCSTSSRIQLVDVSTNFPLLFLLHKNIC